MERYTFSFFLVITLLISTMVQASDQELIIVNASDPQHFLGQKPTGQQLWVGHNTKLNTLHTGRHVSGNPLPRYLAYDWLPEGTPISTEGRLNNHKLVQIVETKSNTHAYLRSPNGGIVVATFDGQNRLPLHAIGSNISVRGTPYMRAIDSAPKGMGGEGFEKVLVLAIDQTHSRARVRSQKNQENFEVRTSADWSPHLLTVGQEVDLKMVPKVYASTLYF